MSQNDSPYLGNAPPELPAGPPEMLQRGKPGL